MANDADGTPLLHGHGDEEDATAPDLLRTQECSEGRHDVEEAYSKQERSKFEFNSTFDWRAPAIILGFTCLENLGLGGISANLVIYLGSIFGEDNASVATSVSTWAGTAYLTPFLGALLADSYLGSYRTIVYSSSMYLAGMVAVTLSASLQSLVPLLWSGSSSSLGKGARKIAFYFGLYLMAFGSGGVKSSLLPLGADQFDSDDPTQARKRASFFNWFYFCMNLGGLTASTLVVWVEENVGWTLGYGISTLCMALAMGGFLLGTPIYRLHEPRGSPLKGVLRVVVACLRRRELTVPVDSSCLHEVHEVGADDGRVLQKLEHTDQFRFLDRAACTSDSCGLHGSQGLCTITQVEEVKIIIRLLPVWLTGVVYSVAYAQLYATFVEQGRVMNADVGFLSIPPASLYAFEILSVMLWVLTYDNFIVRALSGSKSSRPSSAAETVGAQLRRMGVGCLLMVMALSAAAAVEMRRLARGGASKERISVLWQLPQYFMIGGSEVFFYVGQLQFFYEQGPDAMRSMSTAMSLLAISLGSYLSSAFVAVVQFVTGSAGGGSKGWLPDDLDKGHLDYYFWCLALVSFLNFVAYVAFASRFRPKRSAGGVPS